MFGNWFKTGILMAVITAIFIGAGYTMGGLQGMMIALVVTVAMNFFSYWFSDSIVLRMYNAQQVDATTAPQFYSMIQELSMRAGLPMPKVYIVDQEQPNAFATGRNPNHAAVAATRGILQTLSARELRGVMAHELAHVKHRDILTSTISATIAGAIASFARIMMILGRGNGRQGNPLAVLVFAILAPIAAMLIQFMISRTREYEADRGGAEICGDPIALADALAKISYYSQTVPMPVAEQHPETAQMMILNPLSGGGIRSLFSTHPPIEKRIARLHAMSTAKKPTGFF